MTAAGFCTHARDDADVVACAERRACYEVPLRRFARFTEIEQYLDRLLSSAWWGDTFPGAPLEVVPERRSHNATFSAAACRPDGTGVVWIVDGHGWGLETVLHELAHLAVGTGAAHGSYFVEALGELWRHEAGVFAWAALESAFTTCDHRGALRLGGSPRRPRRP